MGRARNAALLIIVCLAPSSQAEAKPRGSRDISSALAASAVRSNPGVAAVRSRIRALQQRVRAAGAWLDPRVSVEYSNIPSNSGLLGDHAMSGVQLRFEQTFLFPGKVRRREELATGRVKEERHKLAELKVQLRAAVKRSYHSLALVRQLRKVTRDHIKLIGQLIDVVRVKYEVGKVGQHDLLRLQVLLKKLEDDLRSFNRDERALVATINAALRRRLREPIGTPDRTIVPAPAKSAEGYAKSARRRRPMLRLHHQRALTRRAAARSGSREVFPDITVWLGYRIRASAGADEGTNFFAAGLSVPIPLFSRRRFGSARRAEVALADAAQLAGRAELDRIRAGLGRAVAAWKRGLSEARAYRTKLMPAAHRTLDATFAAYQVNRAGFASLFQAELQLLAFERTIRRAETKAALAQVAVEALTGTQLRARRKR